MFLGEVAIVKSSLLLFALSIISLQQNSGLMSYQVSLGQSLENMMQSEYFKIDWETRNLYIQMTSV